MRRTLATTASAFVDTASKLERLLKTAEVCEITGLSKTTIWCEVRAGRFPELSRFHLTAGGFPASEIVTWMSGRLAKRRSH